MAYGQVTSNGSVLPGEFLTSNLDFFTIVTVVPVYPTNVKLPLADLKSAYNLGAANISTIGGVDVVDGFGTGQNYANDAAYSDALAKQGNLDTLLKVWSMRANPVVVNVYSQSGTDVDSYTFTGFSSATAFGSSFNGDNIPVYTVKLVSERTGAWYVGGSADDTNVNGYQFLTALDGTPVTDLASGVVYGDTFNTDSTSNDRNTLAVRDTDLRRMSDVLA